MSKESNNSSGGIGFLGLLTILFIGLKLTGYIEWSWIWVLSPLWLPIAIILTVFLSICSVWMLAVLILEFLEWLDDKRKPMP